MPLRCCEHGGMSVHLQFLTSGQRVKNDLRPKKKLIAVCRKRCSNKAPKMPNENVMTNCNVQTEMMRVDAREQTTRSSPGSPLRKSTRNWKRLQEACEGPKKKDPYHVQ